MVRLRLTQRYAAVDKTPYSGDVGNETRQDPEYGKYDNYVEVPGWETQDLNHDWKNDQRNEEHIPVMRSASIARIRRAASKAVRLAILLLGDKVQEKLVEDQAREFMRLGEVYLNNALKRYATTETLYAEEEEKKEEAKKAEGEEEVKEEKKAEDEKEEMKESKKSEDEKEEKESKCAEDEKEEMKESKKSEEEEKKEEVKAEEKNPTEMDIEMQSAVDEDEMKMSKEEEEMLAGLFAEEEVKEEEVKESKKASKKGIQTIGGQVKVASESQEVSLNDLWKSAPDINSVFS